MEVSAVWIATGVKVHFRLTTYSTQRMTRCALQIGSNPSLSFYIWFVLKFSPNNKIFTILSYNVEDGAKKPSLAATLLEF